jgi:hypothetical protein
VIVAADDGFVIEPFDDDDVRHDARGSSAESKIERPLRERADAVKRALLDPEVFGLDGLRREGAGWKACCCSHSERTPSLSVRLYENGLGFHCFGCGRGGTALDVLAALNGLDMRGGDFLKVIEIGERLAGITPGSVPPAARQPGVNRVSPRRNQIDDDTFGRIADALAEHALLHRQQDVVGYLEKRGFDPGSMTSVCALPRGREAQRELRDHLVHVVGSAAWLASGLAHPNGSRAGEWVWSEHRLVLLWRAPGVNGQVLSIQRRLPREAQVNEPKYVCTANRKPRWPFGVEELAGDGTTIVFCEGALDALALRQLAREVGLELIPLGIPGTSGWQREWAKFACGRQAIVALDEDRAGHQQAPIVAEDLRRAGAVSVRRELPWGGVKDWADVLAARVAGTRRAA